MNQVMESVLTVCVALVAAELLRRFCPEDQMVRFVSGLVALGLLLSLVGAATGLELDLPLSAAQGQRQQVAIGRPVAQKGQGHLGQVPQQAHPLLPQLEGPEQLQHGVVHLPQPAAHAKNLDVLQSAPVPGCLADVAHLLAQGGALLPVVVGPLVGPQGAHIHPFSSKAKCRFIPCPLFLCYNTGKIFLKTCLMLRQGGGNMAKAKITLTLVGRLGPCRCHHGHQVGDTFDFDTDRGKLCPMALHAGFPYIDILRYGGKPPLSRAGDIRFCCPDADVANVFRIQVE